jgi:predicted GIY-YIG superfamily endonuclease
MYVVYSLDDPRDNNPFYVGITEDIFERFIQHLRCDGSNYRKDARIQELKEAHLVPVMRPLEIVPVEIEARIREAYWIQHYQYLGIMLCNNRVPTPLEYRPLKAQQEVYTRLRQLRKPSKPMNTPPPADVPDTGTVLALQQNGWGKVAIIRKVWGAKPGGSKAYKQAEDEYNRIIAQPEKKEASM